MRNLLVRKMCNMTCKKACFLVVGVIFGLMFLTYFLAFNHGPPENILAANKNSGRASRYKGLKDSGDMDEIDRQLHGEYKKAADYWDKLIEKNKFVSIGEVYDNCDENERLMIGRTVMIPDKRWAGVKGVTARTFINTTLDSELSSGTFFIEVKYNGNALFSRSWELCTLDEDYGDDRLIYCPFIPGEFSFVKDKQIPIFLPKGNYVTKGWVTNQEEEIVLCGFSDFML